ncbi:MAG TPA: peptidoglycan editing factor PgeF [Caulobacteraceae bacterium]|nr:peptidoglycan editing factor PgeF [Caulobacteraceae bacterium]
MLEPLTEPRLAALRGVRHAFFTRAGGVSRGLYTSLNLGLGSRDDPAAVAENRRRAATHFDREAGDLVTLYQVHSAKVVEAGVWSGSERPRADALVTRRPRTLIGVLAADCAPVLLADDAAGVIGAAHAGWRGALAGVVEATVEAMEGLGATRSAIIAAVGPCIGPGSYEVGPEFEARFLGGGAERARFFAAATAPGKRLFDLPAFVLNRLAAAGVRRAAWIGRDTLTNEPAFFSNRRAVQRGEADYGRLLSAIMLEG